MGFYALAINDDSIAAVHVFNHPNPAGIAENARMKPGYAIVVENDVAHAPPS